MTNDYITATSFNTIDSKGGGSKEQLTEESRTLGGNKHTDVWEGVVARNMIQINFILLFFL